MEAGTAAAASGLLVAGCASSRSGKGHHPGTSNLDVGLLNRSLDLEYETIAAYTAGIPLLQGRAAQAAKRFLDQELSHAGELAGLVKQAGGVAHRPPSTYHLGQPRSARQVIALLHELERRQLALYLDVLPRLSTGATRAAIGAVLGNDAQHLTILRSQLGLDPAPLAVPSPGRE